MRDNVVAIIPARYASTRLPGKPLIEIGGKPMILRVVGRAKQAASINRVIVATDDERVFQVVAGAGVEAVMTSPDHATGTDRLAEVAAGLDAEIVVNVQGDEPLPRGVRDLFLAQPDPVSALGGSGTWFDQGGAARPSGTAQGVQQTHRPLRLPPRFPADLRQTPPDSTRTKRNARTNARPGAWL